VSNDRREALKNRTKQFAIDAVRLCELLPRTTSGNVVCRQLVRSATSTAANYRAACRARSDAECEAKLGIVEEEVDESAFWLEFERDMGYLKGPELTRLSGEANELTAITVASIVKMKQRRKLGP